MDIIENKVAKSGLITIDLEELKPNWDILGFDISSVLVEGLMLREKDFREFINSNDWSPYSDKHLHVYCSTDAIVPTWAYMLLSSKLSGVAKSCVFGTQSEMKKMLWLNLVENMDYERYTGERVIVKGCATETIDEAVYMLLAQNLTPFVKSLMFGEPCSTVPIFKKK